MKDKYLTYFLDKIKSGEFMYKDGKLYKWLTWKKRFKEVGRKTSKGYRQLIGQVDGKEISCVSHRAIYAYFHNLDELPENMEINHINGIKDDNRIENLELVTPSQNQKHAYKTGLKKQQIGELNPAAKLTNKEVFVIKALIEKGVKSREIAKMFNCTEQNIHLIKKGIKWKEIVV